MTLSAMDLESMINHGLDQLAIGQSILITRTSGVGYTVQKLLEWERSGDTGRFSEKGADAPDE